MNGPLDEDVSNITSIMRIPHASKHFYNFVYVMAIIAPFSFSIFELVLDVGLDVPRFSRSWFNRHSRVNPSEEVISSGVDPCSVGQSARRKGFFVVMEEVDDVVYEFLWKAGKACVSRVHPHLESSMGFYGWGLEFVDL